jgi:hypothetical protein
VEYNVTAFGAETGGLNELGYNLFAVTGNEHYLTFAGMFEHPEFLQVPNSSRHVFVVAPLCEECMGLFRQYGASKMILGRLMSLLSLLSDGI